MNNSSGLPFQSGCSVCYPSKDYQKFQKGGNKKKSKKSYTFGMDCKGGKMNITASIRQSSKPSDLEFNGSFSELQKNWAKKLTGDGVKQVNKTQNLNKVNQGIAYSTSGGKQKRKNRTQRGGKDELRENQDKYVSLTESKTSTAENQGQKANQMGMGHKKNLRKNMTNKKSQKTKKQMKGGTAPYPFKDNIPTDAGNAVFNFGRNPGVSTNLLSTRAKSNSAITPYAKSVDIITRDMPLVTGGTSSPINSGAYANLQSTSPNNKKTLELKGGAKTKKSPRNKTQKGSGSDFLTTVRSMGASNAPTMNEKQFRSFNKTDKVPGQKMMPYMAAPCSTGFNTSQCNMGKVEAYNNACYSTATGGSKKTTTKKPTTKKPATKKPATKKPATKKTTTKKTTKK